MIGGSAVCCLSMLAIAAADASADVTLLLAGMCTFIVAFRHALAPPNLFLMRLHAVESPSKTICGHVDDLICTCILGEATLGAYVSLYLFMYSRAFEDGRAHVAFCAAQRVLGGSLLGAHVGDVQHERQVSGRVRGHRDAVPRRWAAVGYTMHWP